MVSGNSGAHLPVVVGLLTVRHSLRPAVGDLIRIVANPGFYRLVNRTCQEAGGHWAAVAGALDRQHKARRYTLQCRVGARCAIEGPAHGVEVFPSSWRVALRKQNLSSSSARPNCHLLYSILYVHPPPSPLVPCTDSFNRHSTTQPRR